MGFNAPFRYYTINQTRNILHDLLQCACASGNNHLPWACLAWCRVWTNAASALALAAGLNTTGFCYQVPLYPGSSRTAEPSASLSGTECADPNQYVFWDAV